MKFFKPKPITIISSNVGENEKADGTTMPSFSISSGYNKGYLVQYGKGVFEALTTIYPLATYIWEDLIDTDKHGVLLVDGTTQYPVSGKVLVSIISGITVVYVRSLDSYYIAKTTATVDFMTENVITPSHFDKVTATPAPYRNEQALPIDEQDTIWWGYNSPANKYAILDRAIGTLSYKYGPGATLDYSLSCNSSNAIALLFMDAADATINVYDNINPLSPILLFNDTISFIDLAPLNTYEKVCTLSVPHKANYVIQFQTRYALRIDISLSKSGGSVGLGAVKVGLLESLGRTKDSVNFNLKSYNTVTQRTNGTYVWNASNKESNKVFNLKYDLSLDTTQFDNLVMLLKSLNDSEVVLLGDDGDPQGYSTLINYGVVKNTNATLISNNTKSPASLEIENFI